MTDAKTIIRQIGSKNIAAAFGVGATAVGNASSAGIFPASWAVVLRALAQEHNIVIPDSLFSFKSLAETLAAHENITAPIGGESQENEVSHG